MPKPATGLYNRPKSSVYQWRIRVPKDLAHLYSGKDLADRRSLKTSIRADATRLAAGPYATWLTKFDQQRKQLNPQPAQGLTPELIQFLAEKYRHDLIGHITITVEGPRRNSIRISGVAATATGLVATGSGCVLKVTGTNACGWVTSIPWRCSRIQRCTMLALMPCCRATAVMDAPGCAHVWRTCSLSSRL